MSFPITGIFVSCRLRTRSARKSAARISAGSCESTARGRSISASREKTRVTSSGVASNPKPRSTISAPSAKNRSVTTRRSSFRCASMISASTFILEVPPIFVSRIRKSNSASTSRDPMRCIAPSAFFAARKSSAGTVRERGTVPSRGRTSARSAAWRGPR